ncbi:precorrin-6A reductase, partial [Herbaspirillum frisingense]
VVVSTATDYGGQLARGDCPGVFVWSGRQGVEARRQALRDSQARVLVDATHPFAVQMSQQLMSLAQELGIPYLRYERPSEIAADDPDACTDMQEAAARAIAMGRRIFLATGSKDLATFLQASGAQERQWFTRVTADPDFLRRAMELGLPRAQLCAMQGPFSQAFNEALWRDWGIDCVVTKDSGEAGGYRAKVEAARALGIPLLTVRRPRLDYPQVTHDFAEVHARLAALAGA